MKKASCHKRPYKGDHRDSSLLRPAQFLSIQIRPRFLSNVNMLIRSLYRHHQHASHSRNFHHHPKCRGKFYKMRSDKAPCQDFSLLNELLLFVQKHRAESRGYRHSCPPPLKRRIEILYSSIMFSFYRLCKTKCKNKESSDFLLSFRGWG